MYRPSISARPRWHEHRHDRRRMRQRLDVGLAEHHRLHLRQDGGKGHAERQQQQRVVHGNSRIAVVRIRNSLANTPNGGMPRIASVPIISPQPTTGLTRTRPRMSSMTCVPAFWRHGRR